MREGAARLSHEERAEHTGEEMQKPLLCHCRNGVARRQDVLVAEPLAAACAVHPGERDRRRPRRIQRDLDVIVGRTFGREPNRTAGVMMPKP